MHVLSGQVLESMGCMEKSRLNGQMAKNVLKGHIDLLTCFRSKF